MHSATMEQQKGHWRQGPARESERAVVAATDTTVSDGLRVERDGKVAILTLCRPERRNALDAELCTAIAAALEELADDGSDAPGAPSTSDASGEAEVPVRAVLIRGEGPAFCAGANLKGGAYAAGFFATVEKMIAAISSVPFPVIADVQGPAVGAGCQLVLSCDLRVMGPGAKAWVPAVNHGFALDRWTISRAGELLGGSVARNVLIAGEKVDQQAAVTSGFATRAGDSAEALAFAHHIAGLAPMPMHHFKLVLNNPSHTEPSKALLAEMDMLGSACWVSEDAAEARAARAAKRPPEFLGR